MKDKTQSLYEHAKKRIPGGTQLLSKRPEMVAPGLWPPYFSRAEGCETWDLEGRHYYDMSFNGIAACLLGFADPDVSRAVKDRIDKGSMCSLNPPEEVELADILCRMHPWAEQVRFARTGGEICAIAVRIARAASDRSKVAVCGYHGWHDWYLASNLGENDALRGHLLPGLDPLGVPRELRGTSLTFSYNNREEFDILIDEHGSELAAVMMEPTRNVEPAPGFLEHVKKRAHEVGAFLIFDEVSIGFRLAFGGAHLRYGVDPDLAVFAKSLGNGHPIAAVIGKKTAMEAAQGSFISSTYWTESVGPVAALAVLQKMQGLDVPAYLDYHGKIALNYWRESAAKYGLEIESEKCFTCLPHFEFVHPQSRELKTLYSQLMLERGFLANTKLYMTLAHNEEILAKYGEAIDEVFSEISKIIEAGDISESLKGPVAHSSFRRLL